MNIYCLAIDANNIQMNTQYRKEKKYDLQTGVISNCDKILALIEYSFRKNMISGSTCESWTALVRDIKYMTIAWRSKGI